VERNNYIIDFYKKTGSIPKIKSFRFEDPFKTAFKLSPERAFEWLKQRGKNLKISTDWDELDSDAHNKAFTVAKVMNADILQLIYDYVERAKTEGWTLKDFQTKLMNRVQSAGWTGATPSKLKVIYDTNMQMAYSQGKYKQQKLISDLYPYWKYSQIERPTKRHDHSLLNGKVFRHDDSIWDLVYPPSGFGCKCSVTPIKDGTNAEEGSNYLEQLKNSKEFQLTPLKTWKPDTDNFTKEIRNQLNKLLLKNNGLYRIEKLLKKNNIKLEINHDNEKTLDNKLLNEIIKLILNNKHISSITKIIIDKDGQISSGFEAYGSTIQIGYKLLTDKNEFAKFRKRMSTKFNNEVNTLSEDDFIDYLTKHELAHIKHLQLQDVLGDEKYEFDFEANKLFTDYTKDYDPYDNKFPDYIFSKYSTINSHEMIAEAIALSEKGLSTDNPYIKKVLQLFSKYYKLVKKV